MRKGRKGYGIFFKITLIIFISFILSGIIFWIFFQSTARNIGAYLHGPGRKTATFLIKDYLGSPPSKFKAFLLNKIYNISFKYLKDGREIWRVGSFESAIEYRKRHQQMMKGMMNSRMMGMHQLVHELDLGKNERIIIYYPVYERRKIFFIPIITLVLSFGLIIFIILLLTKRTLLPIHELIEASKRIGSGDLSYRINYTREDDFKDVVDAFNSMTKKLERMLKEQRELLHMLSHELRTPLARISLALEIDDREKSYSIIKEEIRGMNELIESIMELSRIDYDQIGSEECNLKDVVWDVIGKEFEGEKARIKIDISDEKVFVKSKKILIERVVRNVIENALKYGDKNTQVEIKLFNNENSGVLKVLNYGKGLSKEEIENIFYPFYRGRNSKDTKGKGLGLVVVQRIMDSLGGEVMCKSDINGPTEFTVIFPTG